MAPLQPPPQLQAHTYIIHRNQISEVVGKKLLFSLTFLPLSFSLPSSPLCPPSTHHLSSSREELLLLRQTLCGALGFRQPQPVIEEGSQGSRQPSSQATLPIRKMSNSLIVIMRLCHLPIIGMIKDEIFREAGLLT